MSQNSKFVFPIRSSLVKEPEAYRPRRGVSVSGEAGTYPALSSLSTTFFRIPKVFFGPPREAFSPAQKRESNRAPFRCQHLFFKKPAVSCSALRRRPASETFRPAAARTGYAPLCPPCQRLFRTFFVFFSRHCFSSLFSQNYHRSRKNSSVLRLEEGRERFRYLACKIVRHSCFVSLLPVNGSLTRRAALPTVHLY